MLGRISDDAAAAHLAFADFELRLDQSNYIRGFGYHALERRQNLIERNEGDIYNGEIEFYRELLGAKISAVNALQWHDSRVGSYLPIKLIMADIDRPHTGGAVLQQTIGEPSGRGAYINTEFIRGINVEFPERCFKLEPSPSYVARLLAFNTYLGAGGDHLAGLVYALGINKDLACEYKCLSTRSCFR